MTINKYIGYIRVSTVGQAEDGFGLDIQEQMIRERVGETHRALRIHRDEGVSGSLLDRPGLSGALRSIEPNDVFIIPRLDRLARDLISQELLIAEIKRQEGRLWSCAEGEQAYLDDDADDPSRQMIRQILGAVNQYERAMISLRLRGGRRAKRANGGFGGGEAPFGFHVALQGGLEEDVREQRVLAKIRQLRMTHHSFAEIARELNAMPGFGTRRGSKGWDKAGIHRLSQPRTVPGQRRRKTA